MGCIVIRDIMHALLVDPLPRRAKWPHLSSTSIIINYVLGVH